MSYLSSPRLHLFGEFVAEPSTINNDPANFAGPVVNPGWNPNGDHKFEFSGCTVTSLVDDSNVAVETDPLIGGAVTTPGSPFAKLVDLDVEVQMASKIFGLNVTIGGADHVSGTMTTPSFRDFSGARLLGVYQSTLTALTWNVSSSSWLGKLKAASPQSLSIRLIADLYTGMSGGPHRGRLAGAIGPSAAGESVLYVAGRRLVGVTGPSTLAELKDRTLTIDVGNIVPVKSDGTFAESSLIVAVKVPSPDDVALKSGEVPFAATILPTGWQQLGVVPTTVARYQATSGIESLVLSSADSVRAASSPLGLFTPTGVALALEADDGLFVFPDRQAFVMNPGEKASVVLTARRFGQTAGTVPLTLVQNKNAGAAGITFPATLSTNASGTAVASFQASNPGSPRGPIDGQVFGFGGPWADDSDIVIRDAQSAIAIRVFSGFSPPASPKWSHVQPIFDMYSRMYPSMTAIIDLSDLNAVIAAKSEIRARLMLPFDDPGHMPVTRDLSEKKRKMIVDWIDAGCPA
jgi:hypothetical protein